jgi:hypothetical protein
MRHRLVIAGRRLRHDLWEVLCSVATCAVIAVGVGVVVVVVVGLGLGFAALGDVLGPSGRGTVATIYLLAVGTAMLFGLYCWVRGRLFADGDDV